MIVKTYNDYEYIASGSFVPGRVNEVCIYPREGTYTLYYSDGFKPQFLGHADTRNEALAMAAQAMAYGAGGGFTSRYAPTEYYR